MIPYLQIAFNEASVMFSSMDIPPTNPSSLRSSVTSASPSRIASSGFLICTSLPSIITAPDCFPLIPKTAFTSSLLPAPTRPPIPRISPFLTVKLTSSTIFFLAFCGCGTEKSLASMTTSPTGTLHFGYRLSIFLPTISAMILLWSNSSLL